MTQPIRGILEDERKGILLNDFTGGIVTDIGGALQGGLGMAASGNIHPGQTSLFEPVHGSAPPLAGKNVANPVGAILSAALMLETLGATNESGRIERAVEAAVHAVEEGEVLPAHGIPEHERPDPRGIRPERQRQDVQHQSHVCIPMCQQ